MFKELPLGAKVIVLSSISSLITSIVLILAAVSISNNSVFGILMAAGAVCIGLSAGLAYFFSKGISSAQSSMDQTLQNISTGNIEKRLDESHEVFLGESASLFNQALDGLIAKLNGVHDDSETIHMCVDSLDENAHNVAAEAKSQAAFTQSVTAATQEVSSNISSIAETSKVMSDSAESITVSLQEMNNTVSEIAQNCAKESTIANKAVEFVQQSTERVEKLEFVVQEIDKITETIADISGQTNLLALNATIEASRAGEAGKGFAVVANEVKELSKQTALATQEIEKQIGDMRSRTDETIKSIKEISGIIEEINEISQTIVAAVEEQSVTINQVSDNMNEVNSSSTGISDNIEQISIAFDEVLNNVSGMGDSFQKSADGIEFVTSSLDMLKDLVDGLEKSSAV